MKKRLAILALLILSACSYDTAMEIQPVASIPALTSTDVLVQAAPTLPAPTASTPKVGHAPTTFPVLLSVSMETVNLRPAPGLHNQPIAVLAGGDQVQWFGGKCMTDELGISWIPVRYHGMQGWISSQWVRPNVCR